MFDVATLIYLHNVYCDQVKQKHLVGNMIVHRKRDDLIAIKQMLIDEKHCSKALLDYTGKL